jgi:hypothetical protein
LRQHDTFIGTQLTLIKKEGQVQLCLPVSYHPIELYYQEKKKNARTSVRAYSAAGYMHHTLLTPVADRRTSAGGLPAIHENASGFIVRLLQNKAGWFVPRAVPEMRLLGKANT